MGSLFSSDIKFMFEQIVQENISMSRQSIRLQDLFPVPTWNLSSEGVCVLLDV